MKGGLNYIETGHGEPAIVFLHYFGGSADTWQPVMTALRHRYHCVAVNLPGFGNAASPAYALSINEQAQLVIDLIKALKLRRFVLAGHSMGGKIALAIAAMQPPDLMALILIAPSPPTPEPTGKHEREQIAAAWNDRAAIEKIINTITMKPLEKSVFDQCVTDQLKVSQTAWEGWINGASKVDISLQMSTVNQPLLLIAGTKDPNFPAPFLKKIFTEYLYPFYFEEIAGGHLLPLEVPIAITTAIDKFLSSTG